ncbi:hypothetical protein D3C76_598020 [compost metagenome]
MNEQEPRRTFQKVKSMSNIKFWSWMNFIHSRAYAKAQQHYEEAMGLSFSRSKLRLCQQRPKRFGSNGTA